MNPREAGRQEAPKNFIVFDLRREVPFVAPVDGIFSFYKKRVGDLTVNYGTLAIKGRSLTDQIIYFRVANGTTSLIDENTAPNIPEGDFIFKQENVAVKAGTPLFATSLDSTMVHIGVLEGGVERVSIL